MSITVTHPISGEPVVIENPLLKEHVHVGRVLWYSGATSCGRWDCPAIITRVNKNGSQFKVRSLDDMREQDPWYGSTLTKHATDGRKMMYIPSPESVLTFLEKRRQLLVDSIERAKDFVLRGESVLVTFDTFRATLSL